MARSEAVVVLTLDACSVTLSSVGCCSTITNSTSRGAYPSAKTCIERAENNNQLRLELQLLLAVAGAHLSLVISWQEYAPEFPIFGRLESNIASFDLDGSPLDGHSRRIEDETLDAAMCLGQELDQRLPGTVWNMRQVYNQKDFTDSPADYPPSIS